MFSGTSNDSGGTSASDSCHVYRGKQVKMFEDDSFLISGSQSPARLSSLQSSSLPQLIVINDTKHLRSPVFPQISFHEKDQKHLKVRHVELTGAITSTFGSPCFLPAFWVEVTR